MAMVDRLLFVIPMRGDRFMFVTTGMVDHMMFVIPMGLIHMLL